MRSESLKFCFDKNYSNVKCKRILQKKIWNDIYSNFQVTLSESVRTSMRPKQDVLVRNIYVTVAGHDCTDNSLPCVRRRCINKIGGHLNFTQRKLWSSVIAGKELLKSKKFDKNITSQLIKIPTSNMIFVFKSISRYNCKRCQI